MSQWHQQKIPTSQCHTTQTSFYSLYHSLNSHMNSWLERCSASVLAVYCDCGWFSGPAQKRIPSAIVFRTSRKKQFSRSLIQAQILSPDIEVCLVPLIFCMKVSNLLAIWIYYLTRLTSINDYNIMFDISI